MLMKALLAVLIGLMIFLLFYSVKTLFIPRGLKPRPSGRGWVWPLGYSALREPRALARVGFILRGRSNSFTRVMDAIRYLRGSSSKLQIGIMTIIMEKNIDEIIPLTQWVQDNNDLTFINFQAIMQPFGEATDTDWYRKDSYKELWPHDIDKICSILDSLIKLKGSAFSKIANSTPQLETFKKYFKDPENLIRRNRICSSIDYGISIDYYGCIRLCSHYNLIGDIFHDVREVYYSIGAQEARKIVTCLSIALMKIKL